jgi:hypothetical protein
MSELCGVPVLQVSDTRASRGCITVNETARQQSLAREVFRLVTSNPRSVMTRSRRAELKCWNCLVVGSRLIGSKDGLDLCTDALTMAETPSVCAYCGLSTESGTNHRTAEECIGALLRELDELNSVLGRLQKAPDTSRDHVEKRALRIIRRRPA